MARPTRDTNYSAREKRLVAAKHASDAKVDAQKQELKLRTHGLKN